MKSLKLIFHIFVLVSILSSAKLSCADSITLFSSVDTSEITIGDKITYSLKIVHEKDLEVDLPSPGSNLGQFDILDYKEQKPVEKDGIVTRIIEYTISNYAVGEYSIPPLKITYKSKDNENKELETREIPITVNSVVNPEEKDIRDIKDVVDIPLDLALYYKIGAGVIFFGLVIFLLVYSIRYRRKLKDMHVNGEGVPELSPHEEAYVALEQLKKKDLVAKGKIKEFYLEFSEIIRRYVGRRYDVDALEQTTFELMENLKEIFIEQHNRNLLSDILDESDFVKYAKYRPSVDIIDATFQNGHDFIDKTKKIEFLESPKPETESALKD